MDSDQAAATPVEGVRILGAEEAQAALAGERTPPPAAARPARGQEELDLSEAERGEDQRGADAPDEGPSWSASAAGDAPPPAPPEEVASGEVPPLPHWTEPPTGAVPAIFADDTGEHAVDDDLDAWATITGQQARFRNEGADWAEADNTFDLVTSGEHEKLGALSEAGPVDEEAEFEEALAARRPARARARRAAPSGAETPARPPRRRTPDAARPDAAAAGGRDLPTAIMTAAIVVVVALVCFELGSLATALLAAVVVAVATLELCTTLHQRGFRPATLLVLVGATFLPLAAYNYGASTYAVFFALMVVFSMLWFLWQVTPGRATLGVATTLLTFAYVGGLGGFAGLLLGAPNGNGIGLLIGVVACAVAYDVVGYFVGSQFGKQAIAPNVSPNKTVAGTVGGMVASLIVGMVIVQAIGPWNFRSATALGFLVAFGACFGDLSESLIKRDLGVKDFGSLLPGHGGVLDRFDGLLFCLPIAYYLALYLGKV